MVLGVGVDIIAISRMRAILEGSGRDAFLRKVYSCGESLLAEAHANPVAYLSKTFAAKEAIFKCFAIDGDGEVRFNEIDIQDGEHGEPVAVLSGRFAALAAERKISRVFVSVSYDGDYAIATAALEGDS